MKNNKLIDSKSPYLLQHAENPVEWHEWNAETLKSAKFENKPLFISIGYSTCHWCHVMARESFENVEIADLLNKNFIPIKVDREEMPEIDAYYMNYCRSMGGSCGWPLSVFAMPNGKPFYLATYIPPKSRQGSIGFKDLLNRISALWESAPDRVFVMAQEAQMQTEFANSATSNSSNEIEDLNNQLRSHFKKSLDKINGGFGYAPKFPTPFVYEYLFNESFYRNDEELKNSALFSLEKMRLGGIYDHVGGGFHRYSTDEKWLVPHFEKMLYDQAGLIIAYSRAFQISRDNFYKESALDIAKYLENNLLADCGGFYSAEDADTEHEEGKYYTWSFGELKRDCKNFNILEKVFNIKLEGNFTDPHNPDDNKNILFLSDRLEIILEKNSISKNDFENALNEISVLRNKRQKPFRDEKILTDWNGFAIAALSIAGRTLSEPKLISLAKNCADFILQNAFCDSTLLHSYFEEEFRISGSLDDYAYLGYGLIELYKATFEPKYLEKAKEIINIAIEKFQDKNSGIFYLNAEGGFFKSRMKDLYDNAYPSASSVIFSDLLQLCMFSNDEVYTDKAESLLNALTPEIDRYPAGFAFALSKLELLESGGKQIVIVGDKASALEYINEFNATFLPNSFLTLIDPDEPLSKENQDYKQLNNALTVYICDNYSCKEPITDFAEYKKALTRFTGR